MIDQIGVPDPDEVEYWSHMCNVSDCQATDKDTAAKALFPVRSGKGCLQIRTDPAHSLKQIR